MKKNLLTLFAILMTVVSSNACINGDTRILKNGTLISMEAEGYIVPLGHIFFENSYADALKELDSLWKTTKDVDYLSDYALVLILQKQYDEAKAICLQIEKLKPNRYSTAANLGTIYELQGQNKEALAWIKKAIHIDSTSHHNSEWLHVKILEAKILGDSVISSDFFLNTSFGSAKSPHSNVSKQRLLQLRNALFFQLNERVSFIQPKDKIVAQLLFDLGNIAYLTGASSEALELYDKSKEYGFQDTLLSIRKNFIITSMEKEVTITKQRIATRKKITWVRVIGVIVILSILLVFVSKRFRKLQM